MTAQPIRVLHILCSKRFSGAENVVCQIIRMFENDERYEMVYCSPDGEIRRALEQRGVSFVPVKSIAPVELRKIIKKVNPTVIHAHDMRASLMAALSCGNIPLVSHIHNNSFDSRHFTPKALLYYFAASKAKHIVWVSNSAFNGYYYHDKFASKSSILQNVIDVEDLLIKAKTAERQDVYDAVYLGRLTYPKNPERLIAVLEKAVSLNPDMRVAIIGSGDQEEQTKELIKQKKLSKNVDCLGFLDNPYGILKNAKVMVMTSRWEGLPMCAIESLALGIPIVSTPTDGLCELIEDGFNGYLSDSNETLSRHICHLICDRHEFEEMSRNASERSKKQNEKEAYKKRLSDIYEENVI